MTMLIATHEMSFARDIAEPHLLPATRGGSSSRAAGRSSADRTRREHASFLQRIIEAGRL